DPRCATAARRSTSDRVPPRGGFVHDQEVFVSFPSRPRAVTRSASLMLALAALAFAADPSRAAVWPSNGRALCTATGDQAAPALLCDSDGGAIVAWEDRRSGVADIYAQRVTAGGGMAAGWPANGRALCAAAQDQLAPVIASDGQSGAFV